MRVGIIGGGQLGRMLALEGYPLGLGFQFLEPREDPSVARLGDWIQGGYDDRDALARLADEVDRVTYEFENVPVASVRYLRELGMEVDPGPAALEMAQDRLAEKEGFRALGIPVAAFVPVDTRSDLDDALDELGLPAVLKTRFGGYDGKGQVVLTSRDAADGAWEELGGRPLILEELVDFRRELSIVSVRAREGTIAFYPLTENEHGGGILRESVAPAEACGDLQDEAEGHARALLEHLGYVGVAALELFDTDRGLLANEMAPRVHNSGHWTLDGAWHSQFENHLRAVCGFPLGSTGPRGHSAMVNLLGRIPDPTDLLGVPGLHLHVYDKEPRPLRKIGHVTISHADAGAVRSSLERVRALVGD